MEHSHPVHVQKKRTMVKDRVGCPRTSTYDLPDGSHAYGYKAPGDPESAGDIISQWIVANPSTMTKSRYMTVYQNILAVKNGCVTAKSMRQFGKDHPNIHLKEALSQQVAGAGQNHEGPFGVLSGSSECPIKDLISASYTSYHNEDSDYPDVSQIEQDFVFPKPRPTLASNLQKQIREAAREREEPKHFTMKRFQNIQGTLSTQPNSPGAKSSTSSPMKTSLTGSGPLRSSFSNSTGDFGSPAKSPGYRK